MKEKRRSVDGKKFALKLPHLPAIPRVLDAFAFLGLDCLPTGRQRGKARGEQKGLLVRDMDIGQFIN